MAFKLNTPTNFRQRESIERRHSRRTVGSVSTGGVGENYADRQAFKQAKAATAPKSSFFSKVKDFFLGPKVSDVKFASNAKFVGRGTTYNESLKSLEKGSHSKLEKDMVDSDYFAILDKFTK